MSILVTRPSPSGEQLVSRLTALGRVAYHAPLIDFSPGSQLEHVPGLIAALRQDDLVFALSQHAVRYAHASMQRSGQGWPDTLRYFAIGRTTALRLHTISGRDVEFPPPPEISEALLQLPALQNVAGRRALLLRGNGGRELLAETLEQRGATVTLCECYQRSPIHYNGAEQSAHWQRQQISTLVITSGEMLQQLYDLVPEHDRLAWLLQCRLIIVSERLAGLAQKLGWQDIRIAESADNDALIRALQ
ncbi:uroporphyrinogen-III synthase [Enterobacillus tribolii]|uniref:Uroporphyrinogen-III synthase n=1 Tax=Enterobacillus tribolii TaxID=1487935 RepID=A0A370Q9R3_9GAMM|nr:uroporphyrinogen-III synthase [Enterobacillus tribolii]MBW7984503.1 uroporphyrinogen-III synthase [Enterobacillus tribolii]RDK85115.1 uroporphyrinogen-III synthase [Enterobacillus tribolii]